MDEDDRFGEMVDMCLKARAVVIEAGTPGMVALMDALLFLIGREASKRGVRDQDNTPDADPNRR